MKAETVWTVVITATVISLLSLVITWSAEASQTKAAALCDRDSFIWIDGVKYECRRFRSRATQ